MLERMPNIIYPASFSPQASAAKLDILLAEPSDDTSSASVAAAAAAQAAVERGGGVSRGREATGADVDGQGQWSDWIDMD